MFDPNFNMVQIYIWFQSIFDPKLWEQKSPNVICIHHISNLLCTLYNAHAKTGQLDLEVRATR